MLDDVEVMKFNPEDTGARRERRARRKAYL
jgi:hypothetical protein